MKATTFDYARALAGNHAGPHAPDIDGKTAPRGDGAQLRDHPAAPGGRRLEQRARHAPIRVDGAGRRSAAGRHSATSRRSRCSSGACRRWRSARTTTYGMGLMVDTTYGVPVVHHGGDMIGYHSDMIWLPGAERRRRDPDQRRPRLASPRASSAASCSRCCSTGRPKPTARSPRPASRSTTQLAAERKLLTVPADAAESAQARGALREPGARRDRREPTERSDRLRLRRVEERSRVAARTPTARSRSSRPRRGSPGSSSSWARAPKRTLVTRDAQHEYVFEQQ